MINQNKKIKITTIYISKLLYLVLHERNRTLLLLRGTYIFRKNPLLHIHSEWTVASENKINRS